MKFLESTHFFVRTVLFDFENSDQKIKLKFRLIPMVHIGSQAYYQDVLHGLEARKMLLVSYFEMSEMDALESLLESFKNLVYRQKDIGYHRGNYLNLIRFTHQLLRLHLSDDSARLKLEQRILNTTNVAEKEWLLRKVKVEK